MRSWLVFSSEEASILSILGSLPIPALLFTSQEGTLKVRPVGGCTPSRCSGEPSVPMAPAMSSVTYR